MLKTLVRPKDLIALDTQTGSFAALSAKFDLKFSKCPSFIMAGANSERANSEKREFSQLQKWTMEVLVGPAFPMKPVLT